MLTLCKTSWQRGFQHIYLHYYLPYFKYMAINNKSTFIFFRIILVFLTVVLISDIVLSQIPGYISSYFDNHVPGIISGFFIIFLASVRVNYFSYEDEYEIIHIKSRPLVMLFKQFDKNVKIRYEFPKRIIYDFEIKKGLFQKSLIIHLKTNRGIKKIRKFDLSFISLNKFNYVVDSLEKVSLKNKGDNPQSPEVA